MCSILSVRILVYHGLKCSDGKVRYKLGICNYQLVAMKKKLAVPMREFNDQ